MTHEWLTWYGATGDETGGGGEGHGAPPTQQTIIITVEDRHTHDVLTFLCMSDGVGHSRA